jgi:hypothetical protein
MGTKFVALLEDSVSQKQRPVFDSKSFKDWCSSFAWAWVKVFKGICMTSACRELRTKASHRNSLMLNMTICPEQEAGRSCENDFGNRNLSKPGNILMSFKSPSRFNASLCCCRATTPSGLGVRVQSFEVISKASSSTVEIYRIVQPLKAGRQSTTQIRGTGKPIRIIIRN